MDQRIQTCLGRSDPASWACQPSRKRAGRLDFNRSRRLTGPQRSARRRYCLYRRLHHLTSQTETYIRRLRHLDSRVLARLRDYVPLTIIVEAICLLLHLVGVNGMSIVEFKDHWEDSVRRATLGRRSESELTNPMLAIAAGLPTRSDLHAGLMARTFPCYSMEGCGRYTDTCMIG